MSSKQKISLTVNEIWTKLNSKWKGEAADAFYQSYIMKLTEIAEEVENSGCELSSKCEELSKQISLLEQSMNLD